VIVSRDELERSLAELRAECPDPARGLYGPQSLSWQIGKESILFLGGGRAALLQLSHPWVAHAVSQHSQTQSDPLGRFQRTFDAVYAMVFGDLDEATRSARRVHAVHSRVRGAIDENIGIFSSGDRYEANDAQALNWVHATLIDSALQAFELVVRPLSDAEREGYYQESKRFARLFGIPPSVLSGDYAAFRRYFDSMLASDVIHAGRPALELRKFLFAAPRRAHRPLFRWLELMTAGLVPEKLRGELELTFEERERKIFTASVAGLRALYPRLPERLRCLPAYLAAERRLAGVAGKRGPDRVGQALHWLVLRALDTRTVLPPKR
jgi:uncharacterized protein (DUF2236 family)